MDASSILAIRRFRRKAIARALWRIPHLLTDTVHVLRQFAQRRSSALRYGLIYGKSTGTRPIIPVCKCGMQGAVTWAGVARTFVRDPAGVQCKPRTGATRRSFL